MHYEQLFYKAKEKEMTTHSFSCLKDPIGQRSLEGRGESHDWSDLA